MIDVDDWSTQVLSTDWPVTAITYLPSDGRMVIAENRSLHFYDLCELTLTLNITVSLFIC